MVPDTAFMTDTTAATLLREGVLDPELMALVWLLGEGGVPLSIIGGADLEARSGVARALLSLSPGRAWVVIDADEAPPSANSLAALLQGGIGLGITVSAPDLRSMLEGDGPLHSLPEDGLRRLGLVLVLDDSERGLRCRSAHYLRPSERDGQGHVQRRPPAVLAARDEEADRLDHYAWGITPELADRVDRAQADLEERQRDRARFLQVLGDEDGAGPVIERRLQAYLESEPARVPAPPRDPAQPSAAPRGLVEPHQH